MLYVAAFSKLSHLGDYHHLTIKETKAQSVEWFKYDSQTPARKRLNEKQVSGL